VLEAAGVKIDLGPERIGACIETVGVGFLFAPLHHGAMRHAIGPRREMGVRTIFNLLGPLTNPAGAPNQVMGVFDDAWVEPLAHVLKRLGSQHVLVVHSEDGLDEISVGASTRVAEVKDGEVRVYRVAPEDFGFPRHSLDTLRVQRVDESLAMIRGVLAGNPGPARDIIALNAGAGIYVAGLADTLGDGVQRALAVMADGSAARVLEQLVNLTNRA
jgi:anthranilate phosphoribosyltransferase